jgi:hypothetical protein
MVYITYTAQLTQFELFQHGYKLSIYIFYVDTS